jgi:hypothetical protein
VEINVTCDQDKLISPFRAHRVSANDDRRAENNISNLSVGPNRSRMKEWTSIQTSNSCALACSGGCASLSEGSRLVRDRGGVGLTPHDNRLLNENMLDAVYRSSCFRLN